MNQPTNKLNKELYKEITKLHDENVAKAYTLFIDDGLTDSKAEALAVDIEQFREDFVAYDTLEDWLREWMSTGVVFPELQNISEVDYDVIDYIDWVKYFKSHLSYDYTTYARTTGKDYSSGFINCSSFSYSEPYDKEHGHNQEVLHRLRNSLLIVFRRD